MYLQLADELREEIRSGQRPPGSQLPTESEFNRQYGVSRTTVKATLRQLVSEGLVITRKGFGSYVRERPPVRRVASNRRHAMHRASGKPVFDTEVEAQGQRPSRRMLEVGQTTVPADVAKWLEVPTGSPVIVRRRLQLINDVPAVLSATFFPLWLAKGTKLERPAAIPEGPDAAIEGLGHRFAHGVEVFRAPSPRAGVARTPTPG